MFAPLSGFVTPHTFNFLQSILFVLVVMFLSLGSMRAAIVPGVAVPLSLVGAAFLLPLVDRLGRRVSLGLVYVTIAGWGAVALSYLWALLHAGVGVALHRAHAAVLELTCPG